MLQRNAPPALATSTSPLTVLIVAEPDTSPMETSPEAVSTFTSAKRPTAVTSAEAVPASIELPCGARMV